MITLKGKPQSTNHIYKRTGSRIYMTSKAKELKESYQWQAKDQWDEDILDGNLGINIRLFFSDNRRRDWDNWHKISIDSLEGIVFEDDSQIQEAFIEKDIDRDNPRIEIDIYELD